LLLGQVHHLLLAVGSVVLPALEPAGEWMLQVVDHVLTGASDPLALLNVVFPGVESLGNNREFRISEE